MRFAKPAAKTVARWQAVRRTMTASMRNVRANTATTAVAAVIRTCARCTASMALRLVRRWDTGSRPAPAMRFCVRLTRLISSVCEAEYYCVFSVIAGLGVDSWRERAVSEVRGLRDERGPT